MIGYGTYNQPPGTWSDDSSLAFCQAGALATGFRYYLNIQQAVAENFVKWYYLDYWTPHGERFDVGNATKQAILNLSNGMEPMHAGGKDEYSKRFPDFK